MAGESCAARDQDFRIPAKTKARDGSVLTTRQRIEPLVSDKTAIFGKLRGVFRRKKI